MPSQDTTPIKEKIISALRIKGPSLPIHISGEVKISPLFASAFLSELIAEKRVQVSHMKVGNSPLYLIPGQESRLEKYANHLKSKEKDAFLLLQEKKILKDKNQHPAIRVALRAIRDFAIPFRKEEEIYWRYFTAAQPIIREIQESAPAKEEVKNLNIFDKEEHKESEEPKIHQIEKLKPKKIKKKKTTKKKSDIFFNKVKEYLSQKSVKILEVESLGRNELVLRIESNGKENLLIAHNKKRISELDIIKAGRRASEMHLQYTLLSLGGPLKKVENLIHSLKNLDSIETLK
jgi:hypothetical protein